MQLHNLQPKTQRLVSRRIGRGGKRGTTSGKGTKGQKSRAGAGVKPGFRGGDNRLWQLFPKRRGAGKKPGNARPHRKHRFFRYQSDSTRAINVERLNMFSDGETVTPTLLQEHGFISDIRTRLKILGGGELKRKLTIEHIPVSESAAEKIKKAGGKVAAK